MSLSDRPDRPRGAGPVPRVLLAAAALVALQGAALLVVGVVLLGATVLGDPTTRLDGLTLAVATALAGILLLVLGRGLSQARPLARGPVLALELVALPVGLGVLPLLPAGAVVALVTAVAVLVLLLLPPSVAALKY